MNLGDLRDSFRFKAGDKAKPPLWGDKEVDRLINLAYVECVDRGLVIFDRDTFTIDTVATTWEYQLDPTIIRIKQAWLVGLTVDSVKQDDQPIFSLTSDEVLDWTRWYRFGGDIMYQTVSFGTTRYGVTENGTFIVVPTPTEVRTIRLEVWRYPKDELKGKDDEPEFAPIYHDKMLSWALYLAYRNQDAETVDGIKAAQYEADFERDFGPPVNARGRRAQLENRILRTRPSPF